MRLLRDTCTIQRAGTVEDPYGGAGSEPDWDNPTETEVACSIQPGASREETGDREIVVAAWVGYFPAGTDLVNTDRILWRGSEFTVAGDVGTWVHGTTSHHLEVPLQKVG